MFRSMITALAAGLVLAAPGPVVAQQDDKATRAEQRQRLEEAQRRLEEAVREVAELSADAYGPALREALRMRSGTPRRAMLGINLGEVEPGTGGVKVVGVSPGGPAAEAGVAAGDVIVSIDGRRVESGRDLTTRMREVEPDARVALGLRRDGKDREVVVQARPAADTFWGDLASLPIPGRGRFPLQGWADTELVTMTPGLGRYFGTDRGVLVIRVPRDAGTGLEEGDVILSIGGRQPDSGAHALRILQSYQPGEQVALQVMRERKQRDISIVIPGPVAPSPPPSPTPPTPPRPPREPG
jgi:S1-C subfamily serine protease